MQYPRFSLRFLLAIVTAFCVALFLVISVVDFFSEFSQNRSVAINILSRFAPVLFIILAVLVSRRRFLILLFMLPGAFVGFLFSPSSFTTSGHRRLPTLWEEFFSTFVMYGFLPLLGALIGFMIGFGFVQGQPQILDGDAHPEEQQGEDLESKI